MSTHAMYIVTYSRIYIYNRVRYKWNQSRGNFQTTQYAYQRVGTFGMHIIQKYVYITPRLSYDIVSYTPAPERITFRLSEIQIYISIKASPHNLHNMLSNTHTPDRLTFRWSEFSSCT